MSTPPPEPRPGGIWYPVVKPDGSPGWQWVPQGSPGPPPAAQPVPAQPVPAQPVPAQPVPAQPVPAQPVPAPPVEPEDPSPSGARLRKLYVGGAALVVVAVWGVMFGLDRADDDGIGVAPVTATTSPTPTPVAEPDTPAGSALADVEGAVLDDKGDGTLIVTFPVPEAGGDDREKGVAGDTYAVLEALADADVEFSVVIVRGIAQAGEAPPPPTAPEVYKASFTTKAVYAIDFDEADRDSLDGLRERSVNENLTLAESHATEEETAAPTVRTTEDPTAEGGPDTAP